MMRFLDQFRQALRIEARGLYHGGTEILVVHTACVAGLLEIQKPRAALDVGEHFNVCCKEKIEVLPAYDGEPHKANQFLVVQLADAEEIHELAIEIVQNLDFGWFLLKKDLCSTGERLDVGLVLRKDRDDLFCNRAFAADVGERTSHDDLELSGKIVALQFDLYVSKRSLILRRRRRCCRGSELRAMPDHALG
jgi:hypothetical protein